MSSSEFQVALQQAVAMIQAGQRFLVAAHARLDGDAIGSMLVTAHGLRQLGKEVYLYNPDKVPRRFAFLPGASDIRRKVHGGLRCDATLVHDCGARHLLGEQFPNSIITGPLIVLDHHTVVSELGDLTLRDPAASSAGVIAWRLLAALGLSESTMSLPVATALFTSLVEDSGWFRYPGTDGEAFRLAGACVAAGVSTWDTALHLDESHSEASLRLLVQVLPTLERHCERRLAILTLTDQHLHNAQASLEDVGKLVNYARAIAGVEVGALVTVSDHRCYISLRAKGGLDVGSVSAQFGGGGHFSAAGCVIPYDPHLPDAERPAHAKAQLIAAITAAFAKTATPAASS